MNLWDFKRDKLIMIERGDKTREKILEVEFINMWQLSQINNK